MSPMPFRVPELTDAVINHFDGIMKRYDLDYFIAAGTCLGIIRDGGYINGDQDVDMCVLYESQEQIEKIKSELQRFGFEMKGIDYTNHEDVIKKYGKVPSGIHFFLHDILIDVHPMYKVNDSYYFSNICKFDCSIFNDFGLIEYNDIVLRIPRDVEKYLKSMYLDWQTPTKINEKGWRIK